jgi:hypothetical protein
VEGCCEHGDEPSAPMECWGLTRVTDQLAIFQEGLCSMELFCYLFGYSLNVKRLN